MTDPRSPNSQTPRPSAEPERTEAHAASSPPNPESLSDEDFAALVLRQLSPVEPSATLRRQVAELPLRNPRGVRAWWPFERVFQPVMGLLAAAALGLFVGTQDGFLTPSAEAPGVAPSAQLSHEEADAPRDTGSLGTDSAADSPQAASQQPQLSAAAEPAALDAGGTADEEELSELEQEFLLALGDQWNSSPWLPTETL